MVTEVRYLRVVLYTAERAWSHAMEKKTLPDGPNARQRGYLIGRLRKAVKWATLFQDLCSIKGDSRTSLEAELLKSAQMQHGLRFGDYARYRRYCTARLRRLYKSLKFTHGRGKYSKRAITASMVTEVRYLHVVLYTAERAWSHAMEKKTLPDGPNARQRGYLIGRLRKAVKWATLFQDLCSIKGDSRTSLEAEVC
ncbi:signal recognition particle subunit SRP68-like [Coffea eugenioides]|uniref:signal recognition particle subunit SRP68-like n=1 Tax=Coffea eugenioides TaxID=49369 RepID=UPI000F611EEE|nr:signal recognition particle subunit SRP68-like [Coffea eugenioides]